VRERGSTLTSETVGQKVDRLSSVNSIKEIFRNDGASFTGAFIDTSSDKKDRSI